MPVMLHKCFSQKTMRSLWLIAGLALLNADMMLHIRLIHLISNNGRRDTLGCYQAEDMQPRRAGQALIIVMVYIVVMENVCKGEKKYLGTLFKVKMPLTSWQTFNALDAFWHQALNDEANRCCGSAGHFKKTRCSPASVCFTS